MLPHLLQAPLQVCEHAVPHFCGTDSVAQQRQLLLMYAAHLAAQPATDPKLGLCVRELCAESIVDNLQGEAESRQGCRRCLVRSNAPITSRAEHLPAFTKRQLCSKQLACRAQETKRAPVQVL